MHHLVVFQIVHEGGGRDLGRGGEENRRAGDPDRLRFLQHADEILHRDRIALGLAGEQFGAADPGPHHDHGAGGEQQRHPAAVHDLQEIGGEEGEVDREEAGNEGDAEPERPAPQFPDDDEGERRRHHHRARHRDAIGRGERARILEQRHQQQDADQQKPVDARDVDLAFLRLRGVQDQHARQEAKLDRLAGEREGAGDHRLAGDHGGHRRQDDQRQQRPWRRHQEERIFDRRRIGQHQRALAEVVQHQRGQHEDEPRGLDRQAAEMPHVRVKRLGPGDGEEHRAQHHEADEAVTEQELQAVDRIERQKDARQIMDVQRAGTPIARKKTAMIGPNSDATRAVPWLCAQNSEMRMTMVAGRM